ncbi:MAG: recombinase family protein [Bacteroidales bacterium]|nr:recombinase family protein [Bacteroidales bacterium]
MAEIDMDLIKGFGKGKKTTLKNGGRAVIYQRVSSKRQEDGFSPETQIECCYEWAKRHNYEVVRCFEGEHESAKTDINRKRFKEMLKFVRDKRNRIDAVIVYSTSRFSRNGSFDVIEELKKREITVFSAISSYDARTASGEYIQGMELLSAKYQNREKAQAVKDNGAKALRSGRWIQMPPRGYDMKTTKSAQTITVNGEGRLIQKAFRMKADENLTNEEVRGRMIAMGLNLSKQNWSNIFGNIFYAGYFSHNFLEGDVVKGPHEPLVSLEDFLKINGRLAKSHNRGYEVKIEKEYAPLLGSIRCPVCGHNLTASLSTKMRKRYGRDVGYYVCSRKDCKCNASTKKVNQKFEDWLDGVSLPESCENVLRRQLERAFPILNHNGMEEVKLIRANLTKKKTEVEQIEYNLATAPDAKVREICSKQLAKVEAERDEILRELEERDKSILNLSDYVSFGLELKDNMLKLWQLGNLGNKKRIQNLIFPDGLVYDKENDDIEPLSKNEFLFVFDLKSMGYKDKAKGQTVISDDLSSLAPELGLEPRTL